VCSAGALSGRSRARQLLGARPSLLLQLAQRVGLSGARVLALAGVRAQVEQLWPESIEAVGAMRSRRLPRFLEWLEQRTRAAATHAVTVGEG
jgi:hypothetical protein